MSEHGRLPPVTPPPPETRWTGNDYLVAGLASLTSDELRQKAIELVVESGRLVAEMRDVLAELDARER